MTAPVKQSLPNAMESEKALLGAMLTSRDAVLAAADRVRPEDMYSVAHEKILVSILATWAEGADGDPLIVAADLDDKGELDHAGGLPYLFQLVQQAAPAGSTSWHTKRIADAAVLRRLYRAGTFIMQVAGSVTPTGAGEAVQMAQARMSEVPSDTTSSTRAIGDVFADVLDGIEATEQGTDLEGAPVPTGYADIDRMLNGGMRPGNLVIVGARPGSGKTTCCLDFLRTASIVHGRTALMFSLEMSSEEVTQRVLSAESQVPFVKMQRGECSPRDWEDMTEAVRRTSSAPLLVSDDPTMTMLDIAAKARRLAQQHDLGLIVVDYLQLLTSGSRSESRQQEVSAFSRQLKLLAKELRVPVVAAAQLNREVEGRGEDAKPRLSDLRESGSLEQDADIVMFIDRPDSRDPGHPRAGEADLIVAKNRGGMAGTAVLASRLAVCQFADFSHH